MAPIDEEALPEGYGNAANFSNVIGSVMTHTDVAEAMRMAAEIAEAHLLKKQMNGLVIVEK